MRVDDRSLTRILEEEHDAMSAFAALLRDEQQALVHGELERLPAFAGAKAERILELTRLGAQRLQWLCEHGAGADKTGMESILREHAAELPQARAAWQRLLEVTRGAHQINDVNGTLIATRLNGTQRALSVLFSAAHLDGAYAPDGRTVCYRSAQQLAVA